MRTLLILIAAIAIGAVAFFAYPLLNEGTKSSCKALERRALTLSARDAGPGSIIIASLARQLLRAGKGQIAAEFSRQRNPDIPVPLSCTINYWHSVMDRDWLAGAISEGLN
jgi:hypothetical protein